MKKLLIVSVLYMTSMLLSSCSSDDTPAPTQEDNSKIDLSIEFKRYKYDVLYPSDTIQNEFVITNHSNKTIKAGSIFKVACNLNGVIYNLELTAPQPSEITLTEDLGPDKSFSYNPGYLLGNQMLAYFGTPSLNIALMVYGIGDAPLDNTFSNDPTPSNNKASLSYTSEGIRLVR